jgi:predicted nucleotidyltransferase
MSARVSEDPILKRFRAALDRIYGERIEHVVLYGSRARGDAREDSYQRVYELTFVIQG